MKFFILFVIILQNSAMVESLQCAECMHMDTKFTNMPNFIESLMTSMLDSFDLKNLACKRNTVAPASCNAGGFSYASKCVSMTVTVNAQGMKTLAPDAGMVMEVTTRGCASRPRSEADTCRQISTVGDASTQAKLMQSLQRLTQRFDSVRYNGQVCYSSGKTNVKPTTKSSTHRYPWQKSSTSTHRYPWQKSSTPRGIKVTTKGSISSAHTVIVNQAVFLVCLWILLLTR